MKRAVRGKRNVDDQNDNTTNSKQLRQRVVQESPSPKRKRNDQATQTAASNVKKVREITKAASQEAAGPSTRHKGVAPASSLSDSVCLDGGPHRELDDDANGDTVCTMCGLVMLERLGSAGVEWAKQSRGAGDQAASFDRHGDYSELSQLMGGNHLGTSLDFSQCRNPDDKQPANRTQDDTRWLMQGCKYIQDLCHRLNIENEEMRNRGFALLKECYCKGWLTNVDNTNKHAAMSLYIASLDIAPITFEQLVKHTVYKDDKLKKVYRSIQLEVFGKETKKDIDRGEPILNLSRFIVDLHLPFVVEKEALFIMKRIEDLGSEIITCMNPTLLLPAAIYKAATAHAQLSKDQLEQVKQDLCKMFQIEVKTLMETYKKDILENIDKLYTKNLSQL